jgi:hypothetical protein
MKYLVLVLSFFSISAFGQWMSKEDVLREYRAQKDNKDFVFVPNAQYKKNMASTIPASDFKPKTKFKALIYQENLANNPILDSVDLRFRDTSVKSQIGSLCTAYSGVAIMENLINKNGIQKDLDLSELHAFSYYNVYQMDKFVTAITKNKICDDKYYSKTGSVPSACTANKHAIINSAREISVTDIPQVLSNGLPVYLGLAVPRGMANCQKVITDTSITSGGHALAVVGYYKDGKDTLAIIKNSWGSDCADKGYQVLNLEQYCKKTWCYFYEFSGVSSKYDGIVVPTSVPTVKPTVLPTPVPTVVPEKVCKVWKRVWYKPWVWTCKSYE